ncbi:MULTISPECIES: low molecular weight protein-tyrosine-phosphatase [unclassified Helicobacter]|uniref:low molecular weight protein-tyrosine-phosphatase n=1 Tax=unclassified Helicobacter TaxID=2593540 RepID=UPI000CF0CB60|nr:MULTISPECIES: low molecular weight protein-tyrosine-phosphatase [unclassified Helicobacter]
MFKVVFICLGNICRSPLAEGIAREYIRQKGWSIQVDSAGISGFHSGERPHHNSIAVAKKFGINISELRSSKASPYMEADLFVAMDQSNVEGLREIGIDSHKIVKIGDYGLDGKDIPDPYYKGLDGFLEVFELLDRSVKIFLDSIVEK